MISNIFELATKFIIWIVKSVFEMIAFFLRQLFRIFRLLLVVAPVAGAVFACFFIVLILQIASGGDVIPQDFPFKINYVPVWDAMKKVLFSYLGLMSSYNGTLLYFILLFFMVILAVPISGILLAAGTAATAGRFILYGLIGDLILYVLSALVLGKAPHEKITDRFTILFPEAGRKINEKRYNKLIRTRTRELEEDSFEYRNRRNPAEEFYDDEDMYYENEQEYPEDDEYYDEIGYDERDYIEDSYYENDDGYEDEYDDEYDEHDKEDARYGRKGRPFTNANDRNPSSFNFFAGCNSLESANRKYKSLVKLYHPDNMDGDTDALREINIQYAQIKKSFDQ